MVRTWQMGKTWRLNTFREICLAANFLDHVSSLRSTSGKGKCGAWERGDHRHFLTWSDALDTSPQRGRRVKSRGGWKGQGVQSLEERFAKDHRVSRIGKLKVYPIQTNCFTDGEIEVWRWSGHSYSWGGQSDLLNPGLVALRLVFPLHETPVETMEEYEAKVSPS